MKLSELEELLIEAKKITQDVSGKFKKTRLKDGRMVITFTDKDNNIYIVNASLESLERFKEWHEKEAIADIQKTGKRARLANGVMAPTIKLRVEVKSNGDSLEKNNNKEMVF
ncbi:MAG TPA: hypothetical protein VMZ91_12345 [Candidatus Paceibacterota bacterium]|nr:hypothetical protein [Candidatus Paceibacterota bacterium]